MQIFTPEMTPQWDGGKTFPKLAIALLFVACSDIGNLQYLSMVFENQSCNMNT